MSNKEFPATKDDRTCMRRFVLQRDEDIHGNSGTGVVAEGVEFTTGTCVITWLTQYKTITIFESAKSLAQIHGHDGKTKIVWIDVGPEEKADDAD